MFYLKSLNVLTFNKKENTLLIGNILNNLGLVCKQLSKQEESESFYLKSLSVFDNGFGKHSF